MASPTEAKQFIHTRKTITVLWAILTDNVIEYILKTFKRRKCTQSENCILPDMLFLSLKVPWVGLQCVIMAFPGNTHLLFVVLICAVVSSI